jgi:hypothetical protein
MSGETEAKKSQPKAVRITRAIDALKRADVLDGSCLVELVHGWRW